MTTLPDTLAALAQLLPERVRFENAEYSIYAHYGRLGMQWTRLSLHPDGVPTVMELAALEATLRQEIEGRGLPWELESVHGGWADGGYKARFVGEYEYGTTPAQALAEALLGALRGEE